MDVPEIPADVTRAVDALLDAAIAAEDDVSTEQMMARAILAERERCAKIAENFDPGAYCTSIPDALDNCAKAIRA